MYECLVFHTKNNEHNQQKSINKFSNYYDYIDNRIKMAENIILTLRIPPL